ncbi:MAG: M1 family metallopeptidase [Rhizomicrobium sp.]
MKCSRALSIVGLALAVILNGCGKSDRKAANYVSPVVVEAVPQGPLAHVVVPIRYRLSFVIDPAKRGFVGHDEIDVTFAKPRRMLFLHGLDLDVHGVLVRLPSGKTIPAHYDQVDRSGVARLLFVDEVPSGPATLIFDYEAPFGQALDGLYKVVDRGVPYVFTQFESIAARAAFPSFDEPGFKTPFDVTVTAPAADSVIANSEETSVATLPGGLKRVVFAATKPLPTYLVALAIGPLDIVDGGYIAPDKVRSHPIHLRGVTSKGNGPRIRLALTMTPKLVIALENYFGVAYPFSKLDMLAVPDFAAGAMENAGAITFREKLLLFDANAPLEQKRGSLLVQAHELTHQWFGDLVTPKWWDDTWLNESFANWMGHKAAAAVMPQWQIDTETLRAGFDVMHTDALPSARQIHQPVHTPDDIDNAFDGITYNKGASVLTMFENYVGEDAWRAGIHAYLTKFAGGNATESDFIGAIAQMAISKPRQIIVAVNRNGDISWNGENVPDIAAAKQRLIDRNKLSGEALTSAFGSYLNQPGIPVLHTETLCEDGVQENVVQSIYRAIGQKLRERHWGVPVCLATSASKKSCQLVGTETKAIPILGNCPAWVLPNAGGKGYYRFTLNEKEWSALIVAAPKLSVADQITLLQNADAGVRAGNLQPAILFALIRILAPKARWDVLDTITSILHRLRETGLTNDELTAYRILVREFFGARMDAVGSAMKPHEKPEVTLMREKLATLLVAEGADPATISELSVAAHAMVNGQKSAKLAPDVLGVALRAGLMSDPAFADGVLQAFAASNDEYFRRMTIYAFSGSENPALVDKLLALAPKMRSGELRYLYEYMAEEPVARAALWSWFKANYGLVVKRVSTRGMSHSVGILSNACDTGASKALADFFGPKVGIWNGTMRPLALAKEKIGQCVAFKYAKGQEIDFALETHR